MSNKNETKQVIARFAPSPTGLFHIGSARTALFKDVAQAFYIVVSVETALKNIRTLIVLTEDRVTELKKNVRLGKSRDSEVLASESQLYALKASENVLRFLVIHSPPGVSTPHRRIHLIHAPENPRPLYRFKASKRSGRSSGSMPTSCWRLVNQTSFGRDGGLCSSGRIFFGNGTG